MVKHCSGYVCRLNGFWPKDLDPPPQGQAPGAVLQHFIFFLTLAQKAKSVSPRQTFPAYFDDCG
jgi:hypothetical protein